MTDLICPHCGTLIQYYIGDIVFVDAISVVSCTNCKQEILIASAEEVLISNSRIEEDSSATPVLKIGTIVAITNEEHPWYKQLGLVQGIKHKHYRIEIFGKLIWMPTHWVKST